MPEERKYKILIGAGGTGGHVFPAIALAKKFKSDGHKVVIVGTGNALEKKIFAQYDIETVFFKNRFKDTSRLKKYLKDGEYPLSHIGTPHSLLKKGTNTVITHNWNLGQEASCQFSASLYSSLLKGNKSNKLILRKILNNYIPQKIIDNHKSGFNAPIDSWLRGPLKEWAEDLINSNDFKNSEYFNYNEVMSIWNSHLSGRKNFYRPLWSILIFQSWLKYNSL